MITTNYSVLGTTIAALNAKGVSKQTPKPEIMVFPRTTTVDSDGLLAFTPCRMDTLPIRTKFPTLCPQKNASVADDEFVPKVLLKDLVKSEPKVTAEEKAFLAKLQCTIAKMPTNAIKKELDKLKTKKQELEGTFDGWGGWAGQSSVENYAKHEQKTNALKAELTARGVVYSPKIIIKQEEVILPPVNKSPQSKGF